MSVEDNTRLVERFYAEAITGREVTFTSTAILHVAGDRISQAWDDVDMATLLARIEAP
jgi:predicted ester cyclase